MVDIILRTLHQSVQVLRCTPALPSKRAPKAHHGVGVEFAIVEQLSLDLGLTCDASLGREGFSKGSHGHTAVLYAVELVVIKI